MFVNIISFKSGSQVYVCYGRRTNRFLLLNYGFCFQNNKYNSEVFRVWYNPTKIINLTKEKIVGEKFLLKEDEDLEEALKEETGNPIINSKQIKLKQSKFCYDILNYFRTIVIPLRLKESEIKNINAEEPFNLDVENEIIEYSIDLLTTLFATRYKTSQKSDREFLSSQNNMFRKNIAVLHRYLLKEIIITNLNFLQIAKRIIEIALEGNDIRLAYRRVLKGYENETLFIYNRRILRNYLRLLNANIIKSKEKII